MRTAAVIGTGLIGTSVALALTRRGVAVYLSDRDESVLRTAASLGAGQVGDPVVPVDLAVVAVPPAYVATVLEEAQRRGLATTYTDVASVKAGPQAAAAAHGVDQKTYIGGHPLAGREVAGPLAGRADLFDGRPWVLTPTADTGRDALNRALELISLCGAVPVVMDAADHDHAVALISHAPHVVSVLMAARLEHASEDAARIAGPGVRDVTRIAAGDPLLWQEILSSNAAAVADVLEEYASDLSGAVIALRALAGDDADKRDAGREDLVALLRRGNAGHSRVPGKHGAPRAVYATVTVVISDAPGELARLFAAVGAAGVNIEDVRIEHSPGQQAGLVTLQVAPDSADRLAERLGERGWTVQS
ncbi:prephenate dehydrogenase [Actinocrinis puniceicyclus]|uniref:Prephenate dehydrogenase n=1 Tax=Actinocrinis puniceicyclus TaxID=977794 RepID=A0A8J7WRI0_9ACTN|nr:prephenate dehydrogenase [Actinocrinis puniceicyclus]MBS2964682.1 prephenate dehydrogenase [Actinocrinis puniceicyclus]